MNYVYDVVERKFTAKKRDNETGLDYFNARYFSAPLGRFISPDPLYIEARRLADPQQLNLYSYVRNNPLKFRDPTGMYINFDCDTDENCEEAVRKFNSRSGAKLSVEFGKKNRLQIMKGSMLDNLSSAETALLNAITDKSNGATLSVFGDTGTVDFGVFEGIGRNSVDLGNLSKLDSQSNRLGVSSGDVIAHESLEAYFSLSTKNGGAAHNQVLNAGLPGLFSPGGIPDYDPSRTNLIGVTIDFTFSDRSGSMRSITRLATPIPAQSLTGHSKPEIESILKGSRMRVEGVQFVP